MIEFYQHLSFNGIGFKSANDEPKRDPTEVKINVFNQEKNGWELIAQVQLRFLQQRWNTLKFPDIRGQTKSVLCEFDNE